MCLDAPLWGSPASPRHVTASTQGDQTFVNISALEAGHLSIPLIFIRATRSHPSLLVFSCSTRNLEKKRFYLISAFDGTPAVQDLFTEGICILPGQAIDESPRGINQRGWKFVGCSRVQVLIAHDFNWYNASNDPTAQLSRGSDLVTCWSRFVTAPLINCRWQR